ncbi:MAG: DUF177 domain-containing protein [Clostridia bacterium]|nr:DUF177 domain-containing protein [Clostridia bacterium]
MVVRKVDVDVSLVKQRPGRTQQVELTTTPESPLHWQGEKLTFSQPLVVNLTLESQKGGSISVRGDLRAVVRTVCSRCLQPIDYPVEADLEGTFYLEGRSPEDQEEEFTGQFYSGDTLQLDGLIRESIYLSLPMQFLCSQECKGLCSYCGKRADEGCNCEHQQVDPRFEVLKQLLKDQD